MKAKNNRVLLIGGSGFIGLHLTKRLLERKCEVTILHKDSFTRRGIEKEARLVQGSITDYKTVENAIKDKDGIINLAAVLHPSGEFDPYLDWEVNGKGQLNILEARRKVNPDSKYIFFGTRAQFGRVKEEDLPIAEDYPQNPISLYGIHKQTAENYCRLYKNAFGLKSIILRPAIVYGPPVAEENKHDMICKFIKKALQGEEFRINGFGKDRKDLIYIDDLVDLIVKVMDSKVEEGTFNVGSGKGIEFLEIAKRVVAVCKSGTFKAVPFPKELERFELGSYYADISKVKRAFRWAPKTPLEEGLKKIAEHQRKRMKAK